MSRLFADISSNNGPVDLRAYRKAGYRYIAIKATQGTTYVNPNYSAQVREAHRVGLRVIHYHYATPTYPTHDSVYDARAEANFFHKITGPFFKRKDRLVLDLEEGDPNTVGPWVRAFDDHVKHLTGHNIVLYSYESYLADGGSSLAVRSKQYWIAQYAQHLTRPAWIKRSWAWQRTDGKYGRGPYELPGIGKCDVSVMNRRSYLWGLRP